ncbi:MAG: TonB-dependent receptor plug domain-containing protein [Nibricoccus sp.]
MKTPLLLSLAASALLPAGVLFSQAPLPDSPPPADASGTGTPEGPVITLDAFTVDAGRDRGYVAGDSLAGGRSNLPLRVVAAPISALTRAFIDDVQVTNVRDALRWIEGAVPQNWRAGRTGSGGQFNAWAFSVRGQGDLDQGGNPPSRNYFPNYVAQDLYNVDRVEAARGPNSILFGVGDIGGSIATYTKVPRLDGNSADTTFQFNDNGGVRATADVNSVVNRAIAMRVNVLAERERGWREGDRGRTYAVDVSTQFRLTDTTKLRIEVEGYDRKNNLFIFTMQDNFSLWNGTTAAPTWGATIAGAEQNPLTTPTAPGVKKMVGFDQTLLLWIPGLPQLGASNWGSGYRSMGTNDVVWGAYLRPHAYSFGPTDTIIPALPSRDFTVAPSDGYLRSRYAAVTALLDQKINDNMEAQLAAYGYVDSQKSQNFENVGANGTQSAIDVNSQLPNGQPNPNFGKRYSDLFLSKQNQFHPAKEFRGQVNYHFDTEIFGVPLTQWFSVSAGYRETELKPRTYLAFDQPIDANNWIQHMIWGRLYWDNPRAAMNLPASVGTYQALPFNWFDFDLQETIKYAGAVSQTRLWHDRLNLTLGARRDKYSNEKRGIRPLDTTHTRLDEKGTTYQAGAIGYVLPWLGMSYNYSENFAPLAGGVAPTLYGVPLKAATGKGQTIGLRVSTVDRKYYAALNYYEDESTGRPKGGPGFQGLWNRYIDAGGPERDIGPAGVITGSGTSANASMNFSDTTDLRSHGYEFEFVGNPTPEVRVQMNLSVPRSELSNSIPSSRRYFSEHIGAWQTTASTPSSDPQIQSERTQLQTEINNVAKDIAALSEPSITGHLVKYTLSFFGSYTFPQEWLKGFSVGAGVTALGKQYGNPGDKVNNQRILSPAYQVYNAMLAYDTSWRIADRKVKAKIQLNVDNVLGKETLIYRSYQAYGGGLVQSMDYDFLDPRRFTLTVSFGF